MKAKSKHQTGKGRYCTIQRGICFSCVLYEGDSLQEAQCALQGVNHRRCRGEIIERPSVKESA